MSPNASDHDIENNEGIAPLPSEGPVQRKNGGGGQQGLRLSKVSQMYDIDGDGKLDEIEKAMRDMDSREMGHLSNEKVYKILQEQMKSQKDLLNLKKFVIGLGVFTFILALSNLATAFAAARLAKDTTLNAEDVMISKADGKIVGVRIEKKIYELTPISEERRRKMLEDCNGAGDCAVVDTSGTMPYGDAEDLLTRCKDIGNAYIKQYCPDTNEHIVTDDICERYHDSPQSNPHGDLWRYNQNKILIGRCKSGEDCPVSFDNDEYPCPTGTGSSSSCSEPDHELGVNHKCYDPSNPGGQCVDGNCNSGACFIDSDCPSGYQCDNDGSGGCPV